MGILTGGNGGNAAPNYVPYEERRTLIPLNWQVPARLANIVKSAQVAIVDQEHNNAPYINNQTFWANPGVIKKIQGFK